MPRYVLVHVKKGLLEELSRMPHVKDVLPDPVPNQDVERFRIMIQDANAGIMPLSSISMIGRRVRIINGNFTGFQGNVLYQEGTKVTVRVEVLGRTVPNEFKISQLQIIA